MKEIFLLLTGITDQHLEDLGGHTPLQKASCPTLDLLAQQGSCSRIEMPQRGGVGASLLSMLGIMVDDAAKGPLIAAALDVPLEAGQVAYCVRLCSAGRGVVVDVADNLASDSEGKALCAALSTESFHFVHVAGPDALLITDHPALSKPAATKTLGPGEMVGRPWHKLLPKGVNRRKAAPLFEQLFEKLTYHEVNQVRAELEEMPINAFVLSDGGTKPSWPPIAVKDTLLFTRDRCLQGLAKLIDLPLWELPETLAKFGDVPKIVRGVEKVMPHQQRLFLDIPYLMQSTYRGDLLEKVKTIEWLDKNLIDPLKKRCLFHGARLTILPLRHTDIRTGEITRGPVPSVTYPGNRPLPSFDETAFKSAPLMRRARD